MSIVVRRAEYSEIALLRDAFLREVNGQVVHDSIHSRPGWTLEYVVVDRDTAIGYGSVAVAGPWRDRPTVYEFYVEPDYRPRAFELFDAFLAASGPQAFEVQTSDTLSTVLILAYASDIGTEKIVFRDHTTTMHNAENATLRCVTPPDAIQAAWPEKFAEHLQASGITLPPLD